VWSKARDTGAQSCAYCGCGSGSKKQFDDDALFKCMKATNLAVGVGVILPRIQHNAPIKR
jgi:hypothetical protein